MVRFSLKDLIKNLLIIMPFVRRLAMIFHKTGIMNNQEKTSKRISEVKELLKMVRSSGISIMEIGPGKNSETIIGLSNLGKVKVAYVNDINNYFSKSFWQDKGIDYSSQDLSMRHTDSLDFIYMFDVLEHVRSPASFLKEVRRILRDDGILFVSWDLRDHLFMQDESRWFDMHRYSKFIWNCQMFFRSSYVNRLQLEQWLDIFEEAGFRCEIKEALTSKVAAEAALKNLGIRIDSVYRVKAILN